jgi:hypothetical protein
MVKAWSRGVSMVMIVDLVVKSIYIYTDSYETEDQVSAKLDHSKVS